MIHQGTFFIYFCSLYLLLSYTSCTSTDQSADGTHDGPIVLSTWDNRDANAVAMEILLQDGQALDAIEMGVRVTEADTTDTSVGLGGLPDSSGKVTLDACIMDHKGRAGSVTYLQDFLHPISVARRVMDSTDHVMLSGDGAASFALHQGFKKRNLLTKTAFNAWKKWKSDRNKADNHDTIGMLAIDKEGNISGGCSTSGMAYKLPGRVGDSPIIGAGLYIDNKIGGGNCHRKRRGSFKNCWLISHC